MHEPDNSDAPGDEALDQLLADAWEHYVAGRPGQALERAEAAVSHATNNGQAWFMLALVHERDGNLLSADRAYARSAHAVIDPQAPPFRVDWRRFERSVERACERLPPQLRQALDDVELVLADYPPAPADDQLPLEPETLGLFQGAVRAELIDQAGPLPRISVYRRSHEHYTRSMREFDEEIARTVYHELGHYLGFDEADMERFGLD